MLASIWSRLPIDILSCIIDQIDDDATLNNWSVATRGNLALLRTVLANQWTVLQIDHADLIRNSTPRPSDSTGAGGQRLKKSSPSKNAWGSGAFQSVPQRADKKSKKKSRIRDAITSRNGLLPASFVKTLRINFHFDSIYNATPANIEGLRKPIPKLSTLSYTLEQFFPHLTHVEDVYVDGAAPQRLLDAILSLPKLKTLTYRDKKPWTAFLIVWPNYMDDNLVNWSQLSHVQLLQVLKVRLINGEEGTDLGYAVAALSCLKELEVSSDSTSIRLRSATPIGLFLDAIFPQLQDSKSHMCCLPSGLETLSIVDNYDRTEARTIVPLPGEAKTTFPSLSNITLDFESQNTVTNILHWISPSSITDIRTNPVRQLSLSGSRYRNYQHMGTELPFDETFGNHLNDIIGKYHATVSEFTFFGAWDTHPGLVEMLNTTWLGSFAITDLVLGTKCPRFYYTFARKLLGFDLHNNLEHNLYGYTTPELTRRWGTQIERLRIDQIDLTDFKADGFDDVEVFANLKVLILYPWELLYRTLGRQQLDGFDNSYIEGRIATTIALACPSVRVLVVGSFRYWVHRENGFMTLLDFDQTQATDSAQRREMRSLLSDHDWNFLIKNMRPNPMDRHRFSPMLVNSPTSEMLRRWNYMVFRKTNTEE